MYIRESMRDKDEKLYNIDTRILDLTSSMSARCRHLPQVVKILLKFVNLQHKLGWEETNLYNIREHPY